MEPGSLVLRPYHNGSHSRRLTRRSTVQPASIFTPQDRNLSPEAHFPLQTVSGPDRAPFPRFINRFNSREILLVVDGSCINNGRHANKLQDPVGGCSFIFKGTPNIPLDNDDSSSGSGGSETHIPHACNNPPTTTTRSSPIAFPLEREGPSGEWAEHTSNRAKLRAVIAALQFRAWGGEGWRRVVVLTDLEYIVWGATRWLPRWVARRWRKPSRGNRRGHGHGRGRWCGRRYENRDLWEELQHRVEELRGQQGCEVSFWLVGDAAVDDDGGGSRVIAQAKRAAQRAAREYSGEQAERFTQLCGVMV
ncbi:ribonuclease H [Chaetomidium leptoderma]|uniref:Ribonuclease H n=1 Tax=Chaetomidium leptoderma TaxID=669021 RepID=A0AAN6VRP1_9PEZI|nr:ribonuclease H [Chaetomidium leptoderma]